jgi:hypothetical protein
VNNVHFVEFHSNSENFSSKTSRKVLQLDIHGNFNSQKNIYENAT